jgi:hypothetical protein
MSVHPLMSLPEGDEDFVYHVALTPSPHTTGEDNRLRTLVRTELRSLLDIVVLYYL